MKDRVAASPGRVLITPESGAAFYATLTRADNPTQAGDALNKNTLLKDATAALYGFGDSALPDDISRIMARLHNKLGNEYLWARQGYIPPSSTMTSKGKTRLFSFDYYMTVNLADSFTVDDAGVVTLTNPISQSMSTVAAAKQYLLGKYFVVTDGVLGSVNKTDVYFCPSNAEFTSAASGAIYYITASDLYVITGIAAVTEGLDYVNSPNPNAYPPAEDDGYTYTALGMLGSALESAKITTGNYIGTGTYGSSNKTSLTLPFAPKFVLIQECTNTSTQWVIETIMNPALGYYRAKVGGGSDTRTGMVSASGNTISWYNTSSAMYQLNTSGTTYHYIAIG